MRLRNLRLGVLTAVASGCLVLHGQAVADQQTLSDSERGEAVATFAVRVEAYAAMRARFEEPFPPFDPPRDEWSMFLSRRYLAAAIRAARAPARRGSVFTPLTCAFFREQLTKVPSGVMERLKSGERVEGAAPLIVHEPLPEWAMQPLPQAVTEALPPLPAGMLYRLAGPDLILWDAHAEIVIDVLVDAFLRKGGVR